MEAAFGAGVSAVRFEGEPAWCKRYGSTRRTWRLKALDRVARVLDLAPLRPPPHPVGTEACETEIRRLAELAAQGVRVPRVLARGADHLVLSDIGPTLASRLRGAAPAEAARLFRQAAGAIAGVHRQAGYLGQPLARNIAIDDAGRVGFLDFEEDPAQVMSLCDAQVRDWLLFVSGTARHLPQGGGAVADLLRPTLADAPAPVREGIAAAASRLGFLSWLGGVGGRRGAGLGKAIATLRGAVPMWILALALLGLGADYLHDGEIEIVEIIEQWID